jgi:ribosomal protein S6--L-glutamate ligase
MNLVFLGSAESWYLRDLQRAAGQRHRIVPAPFSSLNCEVTSAGLAVSSAGIRLDHADAVLVRTMPPGSLEQVVVRMDLLGRLEKSGTLVMNPPRAVETAVDKFLTTARLQAAGLDVPRTYVCQTAGDALQAFAALGHDAVIKPLFGAEGRGITRLCDPALAERAFTLLERLGAAMYLQQFVPHRGFDLRLFVVGQRVLGMRRINPNDWRTNLSRGAQAEPLDVTDELAELAFRAAGAVGAPLAGVDLLPGLDGRLYAIEVNAVPGWRGLAKATGVDVSAEVLDFLAAQLSGGRSADKLSASVIGR